MINNDMQNQLNRYFNGSGSGSKLGDMVGRLKAKRDAIQGKTAAEDTEKTEKPEKTGETAETKAEETPKKTQLQRYYDKKSGTTSFESKSSTDDASNASTASDSNLTAAQKRELELKAIMDKLNAEEQERWGDRFTKSSAAAEATGVVNAEGTDLSGIEGFLNDMPLFEEFKTGLMEAFELMDKSTAGSISAQYELNYSTMQAVANAAGGFDYTETTVSVKLDLNYVKAAAGGQSGKDIAAAIGESTDFASLVQNLQNANSAQQQSQVASPQDFMTSLQDYWSPEKTAGRIVDFATAFFPMSDAFKNGGDTEEARTEFAEMMREAIQKGFDQAMGKLGKVPKETQDGIDKTHELTMKGIDDFIKNGLNSNKQQQGVYSALEQFSMSFEYSYSSKSVTTTSAAYNNQGAANSQQAGAIDTSA